MTCRERLMFYIYNYVFVILIYNCLPCCLLLSTTLLLSAILHYQVLPGLGQAHFKSHQNPSNDWIDWWYLFSLFRRYNDGYRLVYLPTSQHSLEIISYVFVKAGRAWRENISTTSYSQQLTNAADLQAAPQHSTPSSDIKTRNYSKIISCQYTYYYVS